jgi:flagellar hook-associated protein 3 FlgL
MSFTRITTKLMSDRSIYNLNTNLTKLNDLQNKLSSGQNINSASDDPVGLNRLLSISDTMNQDNVYVSNISTAQSELSTTDSALTSLTDIIQRARELTVEASTETNGSDELTAIKEEMQQLLDQVVQIGNTEYGNKYIFAGTKTTAEPFTQSGTDITYSGSDSSNYARNIEISSGVTVTVNLQGEDVFGSYDSSTTPPTGSGIIYNLSTLMTDLDTAIADPVSANYDTIRTHLDTFDTNLEDVLSKQTTVGALENRLDLTNTRLSDKITALTTEYGSIQDVDLASVISDLNYQESVYEASLSATAKISQQSLLDYL